MKIGFIGLGIMGAPMASHLQKAGHEIITSINRSPPPAALVDGGLIVLDSPADVAKSCDMVITMLPNTPDVERVILGQAGVLDAGMPDQLIIDMSSISPQATKAIADRVKAAGLSYLDAPVSGGEVGAKAASLTIMAGGANRSFERALPLLSLMGRNITHVGEDNGAGQVCKIANQIIVALNIQAVSEALVFASKSGCDPAKVREALMGGFAASRVLEVHGERMIVRRFDPGFRISLHQKDLDLALAAGRSIGMPLPATALCQQLFGTCAGSAERDEDHSALVRALELLAGHQLA
ncbi:2-hydroxy-3-oxopropionate reductase [Pseudomonas sp. GX19020]|uniref:2-hydroxy-3-oxopropionate reductase n=1 Tax=Pseudomonas sp. GX19020 TaxID=2942277 RepID=UPI0020199063|nr:2-hydroxy-3-oxopropionate reductase [Pseudomonas sp. GX19020]MCL4068083.1 2-hydroxy-3-oxopropionate reductase [Pseudomonas sp. GX19020]